MDYWVEYDSRFLETSRDGQFSDVSLFEDYGIAKMNLDGYRFYYLLIFRCFIGINYIIARKN